MERWFIVRFTGASGKPRYVGEGATMPFDEDAARIFLNRDSAKQAAERIGAHHMKEGTKATILARKGIISRPYGMVHG